ncbi:hypothetical protein GGR50DRAFT_115572 [Xylaria sp. CBS 124048]|nr:hypothetical protein GGR50DRAFT_115572 [Xylaria sp. CBS 124048]
MALSSEELLYVFNHFFLPCKLPQWDDYNAGGESALLSISIRGLLAWKNHTELAHHGTADAAISTLRNMQRACSAQDASLNQTDILQLLRELTKGGAIPLYVRKQNAGVLISKHSNRIYFEVFEICPQNKATMTTKGRLIRSFPGASVALGESEFREPQLHETIAHTLATMSKHPVEAMQPKVQKARNAMHETRDTNHPGMVSETFVNFLQSMGQAMEVPVIVKNTRDDVLWSNGARLPWRRSPSWLLIRVALQLGFTKTVAPAQSEVVYKEAVLFILSQALIESTQRSLPSDLLFSMNAKLSRRLVKMESTVGERVLLYAKNAMRDAHDIISQRWSTIQEDNTRKDYLPKFVKLDFVRDSHVSISKLDEYITWMAERQEEQFLENFQPPSGLMVFSPQNLPTLPETFSGESQSHATANLEAFETWAALHSREWSRRNRHTPGINPCDQLGSLITTYHSLALNHYSGNPEALSAMILTIFELWIACDDAAVGLSPLLDQYDPGVPSDVLQALLLPFESQMQRLHGIEEYLAKRSGSAQYQSTKLYHDLDSSQCFSVRSFDRSAEMQKTHQEILADAQEKRRAKLAELSDLKTKYYDLMARAGQRNCDFRRVLVDWENDLYELRHAGHCLKCAYTREAEALKINIHEWPLPENKTEAKAVVFELSIPRLMHCFQSWRQATFYLLRDVIGMQYTTKSCPRASYPLNEDRHLPVDRRSKSDIGLLSENKPQVVTHRRELQVSTATESTVCLNNGLKYLYFDFRAGQFVEPFKATEKILRMCTYKLPTPSQDLQKYLYRPASSPNGPDPNAVLANQFETPRHMSLEEGTYLASLPLGHHLQVYNILTQLAAPSIDFRKEETTLVILQCLYQAGPPGNTPLRASHAVVDDERLALCLLDNVATAWQRVKDNWESAQALGLFSAIAARLLSLNSSEKVQQRCLELLRTLRTGAFAWVELLRDKSHNAVTSDDGVFFKSKSVDVSLICASTFDIEQGHLSRILDSETDASIFIQCSILIQEGNIEYDPGSELALACLSHRFQRLLYHSSSVLSVTHSGISDAVKKMWSAFQPCSGWRVAHNTTHWLVTETASSNGHANLQVHYNLLSGELLVNGVPLSRPPKEYEDCPLWKTLFGRAAVEVMPTSTAGMQFSAKQEQSGHTVNFALHKTSCGEVDLLVRASNATDSYEILPARLFQGIFPHRFVNDFVHWHNRRNDTLEFRPRETPWNLNRHAWILSRSPNGWVLEKNGNTLLGSNSKTVTAIAGVLFPLAEKLDIHVCLNGSSLEVEIPALRLGFFLTSGQSTLRSREFPGMSVDTDQRLGTLVGFFNKLVLKTDKDDSRRLVLVSEGRVSWSPAHGHINVTVSKASITKIHALHVDSLLGRLIDNGSLQCKLFISYLHALTSYSLPDPLTKRTGVEQTLWILNSAAVRSFDRLSQENIDVLAKIAQLNPARRYYPQNEQVMQSVSWDPYLSCLSQHDGFYSAVRAIFKQARDMSLFFPDIDSEQLAIKKHIETDWFLTERDRIRSSMFRVAGFGAEAHTTAYDSTYSSRDRDQLSTRGTNAFVLSSILYNGHTQLHTTAPCGGELWRTMVTTETIFGPNHDLHVSKLKYSATDANNGLNLSLWPALHKILSTRNDAANKFSIMIWLSAIASHKNARMSLLQILALFFTAPQLSDIQLPSIQSCRPPLGYDATKKLLEDVVSSHLASFDQSPEAKLPKVYGEDWNQLKHRRQDEFDRRQSDAVRTLAARFYQQWPGETISALDFGDPRSSYVELSDLESTVRKKFQEWYNNRRLFQYLRDIETALACFSCGPVTVCRPPSVVLQPPTRTHTYVSVRDLFAGPAPTPTWTASASKPELPVLRLEGLLVALRNRALQSRYETSYIDDLRVSMASLQGRASEPGLDSSSKYNVAFWRQHLNDCQRGVSDLYCHLETLLGTVHNGMSGFGHGPRLSPLLFLQQLSISAWQLLGPDWKSCIVRYGLALTALQRAERLVKTASQPSNDDLIKEMANTGHRTWDALEHPEWLLLEIESGIMIRDVQEQIASEMMNPRSRCNAVMQLNMGEGKSSVIVPMVAAELANKSQLARVIVAKPQSKQMVQMLTSKLGGLLDRRVYHMPFSRALKINSEQMAENISKMMRECKDTGGILLVQPEHILSFQLMGLECYCGDDPGKEAIGKSLIRLQDFFNKSRDIVDESDENFSPKFELIYTMGSQKSIELSPARWICIQQILDCVRSLAADVADQFPQSIDVDFRNEGGFPRVRILKMDAGKLLMENVARIICEKGLDGFPAARQRKDVRDAIFKYITKYSLTQDEISAVEKSGGGRFWTEATKPLLFLIRGILAGGVLEFALSQKRWRVNFGLATARTPPTQLAVPYRAKDSPTPRSEFSHPDVVIVLTSLTYYYGGLEDEDIFNALGHLMDSDQATVEYDAWMKDSPHMPKSFRQLEGINLKDRPQCINDIFPHLKYGKSVIDYFLAHIVFPKEMKEFPYKLSASGWDIGKKRPNFTTGFSGTNDSRKLLPLDVEQLDLKSQSHTNALVLEYLLQPENSVIFLPDRPGNSTTDAERIIDVVFRLETPTRVILDVGAQILELNNQQVAQRWLEKVTETDAQAAVFVNNDDELTVIDRRGGLELLQTSSYATRLDACLVFLDEAHTRGIDLKLPANYRAAVTLGADLTKDRLVQACMRLRKLGRGQSVVFCVSAEIRTKIEAVTGKERGAPIGVGDVLQWAISGTFEDIRRSMPLWAAQGERFLRQEELWKSAQVGEVTCMTNAHAKRFLEDEAQSIEARYKPRLDRGSSIIDALHSGSQRSDEIVERCNEFEDLHFKSSTLQEEQERELSPEIEQERQVQRPPPARALAHHLHPDIVKFVETGHLPVSDAYIAAFDSLRHTSAAREFAASQLAGQQFFVTTEFSKTVVADDVGYVSDSYQRHVQWILSSRAEDSNLAEVLMVISPFEAEKLMSRLQSAGSGRVTLHVYKPRSHATHNAFDNLDFFTIPARQQRLVVPRDLQVRLNLFAGQLYFETYDDYLGACEFLGLATDVPKQGEEVAADGYILRDRNGVSKFDRSPVNFFQILVSKIRRNGQNISKTNVGDMLAGKFVQRSDIMRGGNTIADHGSPDTFT